MIKINNAHLTKYSLDTKNSKSGVKARLSGGNITDPPERPLITINIKEIEFETTGRELKKLQLKSGDDIEFPIDQELEFSMPVSKYEDKDITHIPSKDAVGTGTISEIEDYSFYEDDDVVYIGIDLVDGIAEEI